MTAYKGSRATALILVALGLITAATSEAASTPVDCTVKFSNGTSYDLSGLYGKGQVFEAKLVGVPSTTFYYTFCGPVPTEKLPDACKDEDEGKSIYRVADGQCRGFGPTKSQKPKPTLELLHPDYPDRGAMIHYIDPEKGDDGQRGEILMGVECSLKNASNLVTFNHFFQYGAASYKLVTSSIHGCPLECVSDGNICSGNGGCGFDQKKGSTHCFCEEDREGDFCNSKKSSSSVNVAGVFLIIVSICLVAILGAMGYMVVKLRRLRVDPDAYESLEGRFNELGQLA